MIFLATALLTLIGAAPPASGPVLNVVGFNADATRFAVVISEPGSEKGKLLIWESTPFTNIAYPKLVGPAPDAGADIDVPIVDGKPVLSGPVVAQFGDDRGTEQYKSGTKVLTSFTFDGAPMQAAVELGNGPFGVLGRGKWCRTATGLLDRHGWGIKPTSTDFNLVSLLSSRDGSTFAFIVKFKPTASSREYGFGLLRPRDAGLQKPECTAGETPPSKDDHERCLGELRAMKGEYTGNLEDKRWRNTEAYKQHFRLTVGDHGAAVSVVGRILRDDVDKPSFEGDVVQCSKVGDTITMKLQGTQPLYDPASPADRGGFVQLRPEAECVWTKPCRRVFTADWRLLATIGGLRK